MYIFYIPQSVNILPYKEYSLARVEINTLLMFVTETMPVICDGLFSNPYLLFYSLSYLITSEYVRANQNRKTIVSTLLFFAIHKQNNRKCLLLHINSQS